MESDTEQSIIWFIGICIIVLLSTFLILDIKEVLSYNQDCLDNLSKKLCEEQGMIYNNDNAVVDLLSRSFFCREHPRSVQKTEFSFIEEDLIKCKK